MAKKSSWFKLNISRTKIQSLIAYLNIFNAEENLRILEEKGIQLVTESCLAYPESLKQISLSPIGLYCLGDITLLSNFQKSIAMVGPRRPSEYGKQVSRLFGDYLARQGITLVSGLALGIDSLAHICALRNNAPTIAVLGTNISSIYPSSNYNLAQKIIDQGGLVISEFPPSISTKTFHFVQRNRIISGLSSAVLVVEGPKKSGALITAKYAFEQNRSVFTIPNSIFSKSSEGSHSLIKSDIAKPVFSPSEILEDIGIDQRAESKQLSFKLSTQEEILLKHLNTKPTSLDMIQKHTQMAITKILTLLTALELKNLVKNTGRGTYVKIMHSL